MNTPGNEFGPGSDYDAMAHVRLLRSNDGASSGYTADLIEQLYAARLSATRPNAGAALDLLRKIEYASRKDSLTDRERLQSVRTVVCAAISKAESIDALELPAKAAGDGGRRLITSEMVNAGARELWNDRDARMGGSWDSRDPREICVIQTKATMRAALEAALAREEIGAVGETPAARWREDGKPDPHGNQFSGERAALCGGSMTDDELANAVYLDPTIMNLTAAKERIRWLSRKLCHPSEPPAPSKRDEPVAWQFELATYRCSTTGEYSRWVKRLSDSAPCVPEGSIRDLTPLYAHPRAVDTESIRAALIAAKCDSDFGTYIDAPMHDVVGVIAQLLAGNGDG